MLFALYILLFMLFSSFLQVVWSKKVDAQQVKNGKTILWIGFTCFYAFIAYHFLKTSENYTHYAMQIKPEDRYIMDWFDMDTAYFIGVAAFFAIFSSGFTAITYYSYNRKK
jgi:hypothetical protein